MVVFVFSTFYSYRCSYGTSVKMIQNPMYLDSRMEKKKDWACSTFYINFYSISKNKEKHFKSTLLSFALCRDSSGLGKLRCPGRGWTRGTGPREGRWGQARGQGRCVTSQSIPRAMRGGKKRETPRPRWLPGLLPPEPHHRAGVLSQGLPWRWWDRAAAQQERLLCDQDSARNTVFYILIIIIKCIGLQ